MELEISPEPSAEERDAIEVALRLLLTRDSRPPTYRSTWWQAGLPKDDDSQALARPRNNRGAIRA